MCWPFRYLWMKTASKQSGESQDLKRHEEWSGKSKHIGVRNLGPNAGSATMTQDKPLNLWVCFLISQLETIISLLYRDC